MKPCVSSAQLRSSQRPVKWDEGLCSTTAQLVWGEGAAQGSPSSCLHLVPLPPKELEEGGPGSEGKLGRRGRGWVAKESGEGFLTGMLPLGAGLGPEGSPGAQLTYGRGPGSTHWKSFCEAWRPIQRSNVTLNRLAVMNATGPQKSVVSDREAPCSLCTRHFWGLCQRTLGAPQGLALPCSKVFAMVSSWASCCSQENCASDHFTRSWGSWPWIRKHWRRKGRRDVQPHLPVPPAQKLHHVPLSRGPWGGFGGSQNQDPGVSLNTA